jgi:CheY-like chemotaxis protein
MIADMAEEVLIGHGYEVCGIVRTVGEAVEMARLHKPNIILIDMRLADGGLGTEIAAQLRDMPDLGILYASGNRAQIFLTAANGHACLSKPYRVPDLLRGVEIVTNIVATGTASGPFPRGFQVLPSVSATTAGRPPNE